MASFERAFELPARTLTRWKTGDCSSASICLLKIVATYPRIVEVAANGFKQDAATWGIFQSAADLYRENNNAAE